MNLDVDHLQKQLDQAIKEGNEEDAANIARTLAKLQKSSER